MRIYLDDCAHDSDLVQLLERDGHVVFTPTSEGSRGADDPIHLSRAVALGAILLTKNPRDFVALDQGYRRRRRQHFGIFLVYEDNNRAKDMELAEIVQAIQKLVAAGLPIENELHTLNHWR